MEFIVAGVPDLFLPVPVDKHHGLYIEMKSEKGTLTKDQEQWHSKWRGEVHMVRSIDDVVVIFNEMTLRKKMVTYE